MNTVCFRACLVALCYTSVACSTEVNVDLHNGIPSNAYLAVYGQTNQERDQLHEYYQQVWKTIRQEKLPERVFSLMIEAMPSNSKEQVDSVRDELRSAFSSVEWSAIADFKEVAYGQVMEVPQTHHLLLIRLPSADVAEKLEMAIIETADMIERRSDQAVTRVRTDAGNFSVYSLATQKIKDFPFQPSFARVGDVIVVSSSQKLAQQSIKSLIAGGPSKFDDPRLLAALKTLPKPEDAIVFYDFRQQFNQLKQIGDFIREKAPNEPKAIRMAGVMDDLLSELDSLDYQVTVEYTDGQKILKTEKLQMSPGAQQKAPYKIFAAGKPFDNWDRWVPADAEAFSLVHRGNPHALYQTVMDFIQKHFPEAQPQLDKFAAKQDEWGVHIDRDILEAFTGETVKITVPTASPSRPGGRDTVIALRCEKPEQIRELIHNGIAKLASTPYCQSQNLKLEPSKDLEGFDELSANMLLAFGLRPVIGFHEGWMFVASNPEGAEKVLKTLAGDSPTFATTAGFQKFGIDVNGPVAAIAYCNLGADSRNAATMIRQAGMMAPAFILSANVKDEKARKLLQDAAGLLPSIANVVDKFNFLDSRLSVVQRTDSNGSMLTQSVTLIREPLAEKAE